MRKNTLAYIIAVLACAVCVFGCRKDIEDRSLQYPSLAPSNLDTNAGNWKPVLLDSATQFAVAPPAAVSSPAYIAELNEIKAYQRSLTQHQKDIIHYWSAGAVLRWNEIMRELVAKHNLAPYQSADGSYPAPSSANPFAYPQFPFSNPPYASRAYAYVSAAQYDALIAAWHYKQAYRRPAPYTVDSSVNALVPKSQLFAYPSEDAVVAGTTVEMMKLLFPTELAFIQQKSDEEVLARLMSGANARSDMEAGQALGRLVAQKFTARAKTDKAGAAIGTPAVWKGLEDAAIARGEVCWLSLEVPKRPPQLPLFGKVKPFLFDSATVASLRPGPPPLTNSEQFRKETEEVLYYSKNPTRDRTATVHYWADGVGTYTPPGHWNAIAATEFVKQQFSEVRWARNYALLNMAMMDAAIVCWDTKYYYFNQRPSQADPSIKTLTGVPNFPAYTSGHANFSNAAATVLSHLLPDRGTKFTDLAKEASLSRLYGGIHYRSDCDAGAATGVAVGQYAVARAQTDGAE